MALDYVRTQVTAAKEIGVYGVIPRHLVREHFWYSFFAGLPKNQTKNSKSNFRRLTDLRISHLTFYKGRWYSNRDRTFNSLKYSSTLRLTASNFAIKKSRSFIGLLAQYHWRTLQHNVQLYRNQTQLGHINKTKCWTSSNATFIYPKIEF